MSKHSSRPSGKKVIFAKGPHECSPMSPEQFQGGTMYVANAFLSGALLPKDFFTGVPASSFLSKDDVQRTLLAAYAHFKQNANLALSFFCRYKAMIALTANPEFVHWVAKHDADDHLAVIHPSLIACAALHPLQPNGTFDTISMLAVLRADPQAFTSPAQQNQLETSDADSSQRLAA